MPVVSPRAIASIEDIEEQIAPLRERLTAHPLYASMQSIGDVRVFMQSHVFAVWDFMSLLKSLQRSLTSVDAPWTPTKFPASRRFINEIVLGEESDEFEGRPLSHFEVYLEAMEGCGADTAPIRSVLAAIAAGGSWERASDAAPRAAAEFVRSTFRVIERGSVAAQAAAFTFGREDVIPDLFRGFIRELNSELSGSLGTFIWYLERHVEVDGEDHGPLSLRMVSDLCGDSPELWEEAAAAAEDAIRARIALWDGILAEIRAN
jgi:pyrroloquinoline quinone (PQQ) biosynthesis protein C